MVTEQRGCEGLMQLGSLTINVVRSNNHNCTKTDTSGLVEYTKANERTPPKELGQMAPYLRYEECHDQSG